MEEANVLEDLYTALDRHVQRSEYKKIIKKSDEILKISSGEIDALKCKIVALIQLGSYEDVLQALDDQDAQEFQLEKAYSLYKCGRLKDALLVLEASPLLSPRFELEAQILYRLGRHGECIERYEAINRLEGSLSLTHEMKSNMVAAYVGAGRSSEISSLLTALQVSPKDSFDLAYNVACALTEQKQWRQAEDMLLLARRLGQETLIEEELSEEEVYNELAPITVQLAYVKQMGGKESEAMDSYLDILKRRPSDAPSLAVASNNLVALRGPHPQGQTSKDLFDSVKRMERIFLDKKASAGPVAMEATENLLSAELEDRLSGQQKGALVMNYLSLLIHFNRTEQASKLLPTVSHYLPSPAWAAIIHAALLVKSKKPLEALEVLRSQSGSSSALPIEFRLALSHVALLCGEFQEASKALLSLDPSLQLRPAMVATIVDLQERDQNPAGAEACLDSALVSGLQKEGTSWESLLLASARFKASHGKAEEASRLYLKLLEGAGSGGGRNWAEAVMGLVESLAVALDRPEEAEKYEEAMGKVPGVSGLSAESLLLSAGGGFGAGAGLGKNKRAVAGEDAEEGKKEQREKKRRKKKKKVIWPKGYDPANPGPPPDPERWLPKRERSSFKPKRKDKRSVAHLRGAQGSVVAQEQGSEIGGLGSKGGKGGKGGKSAGQGSAPSKIEGGPSLAAKKKGKKGRK